MGLATSTSACWRAPVRIYEKSYLVTTSKNTTGINLKPRTSSLSTRTGSIPLPECDRSSKDYQMFLVTSGPQDRGATSPGLRGTTYVTLPEGVRNEQIDLRIMAVRPRGTGGFRSDDSLKTGSPEQNQGEEHD